MAKETPMMVQYKKIKNEHPEALLFFRMGDFYEMFCDDAICASKELDLVLTHKSAGIEGRIPMCGVPHHSVDNYIARLIEKNYRVAICEQLEDPKTVKGLVKRDVIRIISPGTVVEESLLQESKNNYLACICRKNRQWGLCYTDISTGEFKVQYIEEELSGYKKDKINPIINEIYRIEPKELLLEQSLIDNEEFISSLKKVFFGLITPLETGDLDYKSNESLLEEHFKDSLSEGNAIPQISLRAAGITLHFLHRTQLRSLNYIRNIEFLADSSTMLLDYNTRRNLELTETLFQHQKKGSLLWVLDSTKTSMGRRLLREWIENPLLKKADIIKRRDAVKELVQEPNRIKCFQDALTNIKDLERLSGTLAYGNGTPRDLVLLKNSISKLPQIKELLFSAQSPLYVDMYTNFDSLTDIYGRINNAICDDIPLNIKDHDIIRSGYSYEVDELRDVKINGHRMILDIETRERNETGIKNLKIKYNKVFGYFIEVSNSFKNLVPDNYIRKQTLVNGERYYTPELKEFEEKVLGADEKLRHLEMEIFREVRDFVCSNIPRIQLMSTVVAILDCITSFAKAAVENNYCCPDITDDLTISIQDGRHPMVEKVNEESFIANDTDIDGEKQRIHIISGANMAGKSTYMRQVALIILMTQIGSFVPAKNAKIGLCDRIFTRIGASDDLIGGSSTFMVEMKETSDILSHATKKSFVVLDEIGRGTSTFDGLSLAWAILDYLSNKEDSPRVLFSTHYHELTTIDQEKDNIRNYTIQVDEVNGNLLFLRKVVPGKADKSYGIHVARLAGLPVSIINQAKKILRSLEKNTVSPQSNNSSDDNFSLFREITPEEDDVLKAITSLNIDELRPIEGLKLLEEWKNYLSHE